MWENFVTRFDGERWTRPCAACALLRLDREAARARRSTTRAICTAAWMTDERPFEDMNPRNAEVYYGKIGLRKRRLPAYGAEQFVPFP